MHRTASPRRHRQRRLILALYLASMFLVLVAWIAGGAVPEAAHLI